MSAEPIRWEDDALVLLDQRLLPHKVEHVVCRDADDVCRAITAMVVRGAPAIGVAAAYAVALSARTRVSEGRSWRAGIHDDVAALRAARPTAVNLMWALDRMLETLASVEEDPCPALLERARALHSPSLVINAGIIV